MQGAARTKDKDYDSEFINKLQTLLCALRLRLQSWRVQASFALHELHPLTIPPSPSHPICNTYTPLTLSLHSWYVFITPGVYNLQLVSREPRDRLLPAAQRGD
jgi:hypothetical protein